MFRQGSKPDPLGLADRKSHCYQEFQPFVTHRRLGTLTQPSLDPYQSEKVPSSSSLTFDELRMQFSFFSLVDSARFNIPISQRYSPRSQPVMMKVGRCIGRCLGAM